MKIKFSIDMENKHRVPFLNVLVYIKINNRLG